jgi:hypothetical protein
MGACESSMSFMPYGPRWRIHRKLFHDFIDISTIENYNEYQTKAVSNFLVNLHREPKAFRERIELYALYLFTVLIR